MVLPHAEPTKPPSLHVLPTTLRCSGMHFSLSIAYRTIQGAALSSLTPALDKLPRLRGLSMAMALTGTLPAEWAAPNSLLR